MVLDARIPLQAQQFSLADLLRNVEAIEGSRQERAMRQQAMERQASTDKRAEAFRGALAEYLLTDRRGGAQAPPVTAPTPVPGATPSPTGRLGELVAVLDQEAAAEAPPSPAASPGAAPAPSARDEAFARMVQADPTAALATRRAQLEEASDTLSLVGRLAGSAVDEETYQGALRQAQSFGLDTSNLPPRYVPQFVEMLRGQAMTAQQQIQAEINRLRLENDIRDDRIDNARLAEALEGLQDYREATLDLRVEEEEGRNRRFETGEEGRDRRDDDSEGPTPNRVIGRILDKQARGEQLTHDEINALRLHRGDRPLPDRRPSWLRAAEAAAAAAERARGEQSQPRGSRAAPPSVRGAREGAIIRNSRTGERMRLQGGRWVPVP